MAIARSYRDGWLTSKKIDALGNDSAELFLFRLGLKADKNGVYHGEPELLRAAAYPLQVSRRRLADVTRYRDQCAMAGLLRLWIAADGRPYVQIVKWNQRTPNEKPQHPLPPGEPDASGQEHLMLPDPPPLPSAAVGSKLNRRKVSEVGRDAPGTHSTLSDDDWLEQLAVSYALMYPGVDVREEFRKATKRYPLGFGRDFFVKEWLPKAERKVVLKGGMPTAVVEPEPEAWKVFLKDNYAGESWADSAQAYSWAELPGNFRAKIFKEMKR